MDTIERGVAEDPRPDAGLGRLSTDQEDSYAKAKKPSNEFSIDGGDVEAGRAGSNGISYNHEQWLQQN